LATVGCWPTDGLESRLQARIGAQLSQQLLAALGHHRLAGHRVSQAVERLVDFRPLHDDVDPALDLLLQPLAVDVDARLAPDGDRGQQAQQPG